MVNDTYHKIPTGYGTDTITAPKFKASRGEERENQIALAKIKAKEKLELAKIDATTQTEVKRIEVEALKAKALTEKEIATSNQKIVLKTQEKDLYLYKIITAVVGFILLMGILVAYLIHRENRIVRIKLEEDKIRHEEFTQANNQYHEKSNKILEIIADKNTDENIKKELVIILGYQEKSKNQILIEQPEVEIIEEPKDENNV